MFLWRWILIRLGFRGPDFRRTDRRALLLFISAPWGKSWLQIFQAFWDFRKLTTPQNKLRKSPKTNLEFPGKLRKIPDFSGKIKKKQSFPETSRNFRILPENLDFPGVSQKKSGDVPANNFVEIPLVNPLFKSVSCVPPLWWGLFNENPYAKRHGVSRPLSTTLRPPSGHMTVKKGRTTTAFSSSWSRCHTEFEPTAPPPELSWPQWQFRLGILTKSHPP